MASARSDRPISGRASAMAASSSRGPAPADGDGNRFDVRFGNAREVLDIHQPPARAGHRGGTNGAHLTYKKGTLRPSLCPASLRLAAPSAFSAAGHSRV